MEEKTLNVATEKKKNKSLSEYVPDASSVALGKYFDLF
jgi:hypothetical protein